MRVQDLKYTFQYGMHGCGLYKEINHANSMEAFHYWLGKGVKVFEIDMAMTADERFVALAHRMNTHDLIMVGINPYQDNGKAKYTENWFMSNKLFYKTTGGLTPMNLDIIVEEMIKKPEIIVMFDLWGMWSSDDTSTFSKQLLSLASDDIKSRCILEVYNKKMLSGIRKENQELSVMYCVHGSNAKEFDENVNPAILKSLGVDIISYPWICTKDHPGELEQYHQEGFTIFSLTGEKRNNEIMRKAGVNVKLVDAFYSEGESFRLYSDKFGRKIKFFLNRKKRPVMREMTIEEAHLVALDIMKEIHEFCVDNDIQYSLAYGSLLGAIRHKGFIPWDDDIDIWMTRSNFEKFTKSFHSKNGYRHMSVYDKDCLICFDRVYETKLTYVRNMSKACDGETGIWVDIMPIDYVPDDKVLRERQYKEFADLNNKMDFFRSWYTNKEFLSGYRRIKTLLKLLIRSDIGYPTRSKSDNLHNAELDLIKKYSNTPSSNYCFFQCGVLYRNEPQELLPASCFVEYESAVFEDTEFMIVKDFDTLLKLLYNDYMTPPPEGKRQKSHGKCLWR